MKKARLPLLGILIGLILLAGPAQADDVSGRIGLGFHGGLMRMMGGDWDYSDMNEFYSAQIRYGWNSNWSTELAIKYGFHRPAVALGQDADFFTFENSFPLFTVMYQTRLGALYHFSPEKRLTPFLGAAIEATKWSVIQLTAGGDPPRVLKPDGYVVWGHEVTGGAQPLKETEWGFSVTAGLNYFVTPSISLDMGLRYHYWLASGLDNIGLSSVYGRGHVDSNDQQVDGLLGFTVFFGGRDKDGDGIKDDEDGCPERPEDFDGFEDADGCPDPDNDGDGIPDIRDNCPDAAEDIDGFEDNDGCPDTDNDGDGIPDSRDRCPDVAEDQDGFLDNDGCPDLDNDKDGVPDDQDNCPGTPSGVEVDANGCPVVAEIEVKLILKGVTFENNSADLTPSSRTTLDEVVESLRAHPSVTIEIQGHTDSKGTAEYNKTLSEKRAATVRDYFISERISPARLAVSGFGEAQPIADNGTAAGRAQNRRVELHRTDG